MWRSGFTFRLLIEFLASSSESSSASTWKICYLRLSYDQLFQRFSYLIFKGLFFVCTCVCFFCVFWLEHVLFASLWYVNSLFSGSHCIHHPPRPPVTLIFQSEYEPGEQMAWEKQLNALSVLILATGKAFYWAPASVIPDGKAIMLYSKARVCSAWCWGQIAGGVVGPVKLLGNACPPLSPRYGERFVCGMRKSGRDVCRAESLSIPGAFHQGFPCDNIQGRYRYRSLYCGGGVSLSSSNDLHNSSSVRNPCSTPDNQSRPTDTSSRKLIIQARRLTQGLNSAFCETLPQQVF